MDYEKYKSIRPLLPEEVAQAIKMLVEEPMLKEAFSAFGLGVSWEQMVQALEACQSVEDFKKQVSYKLVKGIMQKACRSVDFVDHAGLKTDQAYTYISNHRDIILDSAFLSVMLLDKGLVFPQIAIGDNLLILPWVETLVKLNGSFLVKRNLQGREVLLAAKMLSEYMNDAIREGQPLWIAQREGRAKDSSDHTQPALLKMLSIGAGKGVSFLEAIRQLNIVPTSCSYEFDPCDFLKAQEMQIKRDCPDYKKSKADDGINMKTGVFGYKGAVHFATGKPLNEALDREDWSDMRPADQVVKVAELIDKEIYRAYKMFPCNYVALDMLTQSQDYTQYYTAEDKAQFEKYLAERLSLIKLPEGLVKDEEFLTARLLEMYANPAKNYLSVQG